MNECEIKNKVHEIRSALCLYRFLWHLVWIGGWNKVVAMIKYMLAECLVEIPFLGWQWVGGNACVVGNEIVNKYMLQLVFGGDSPSDVETKAE
jgi:hypothetical protein